MNGVFALQKIPRCDPDVIVLDIEMPEMNGIEFLKERRRLGLEIPVIILSSVAKEGAEVTIEALSLGASDFITKPSGSVSSDIHTVAGELAELPNRKPQTGNAGGLCRLPVLDLGSSRELEQHLAGCASCRSAAADQAAVWNALDAWEAPAIPSDFNRRLYQRIEDGVRLSWWERLTRSFRPMPLRTARL